MLFLRSIHRCLVLSTLIVTNQCQKRIRIRTLDHSLPNSLVSYHFLLNPYHASMTFLHKCHVYRQISTLFFKGNLYPVFHNNYPNSVFHNLTQYFLSYVTTFMLHSIMIFSQIIIVH